MAKGFNEKVASAAQDVTQLLRADGAELVVVDCDETNRRVAAEVRFTRVACADCILPEEMIREFFIAALEQQNIPDANLELKDPRTTSE